MGLYAELFAGVLRTINSIFSPTIGIIQRKKNKSPIKLSFIKQTMDQIQFSMFLFKPISKRDKKTIVSLHFCCFDSGDRGEYFNPLTRFKRGDTAIRVLQ